MGGFKTRPYESHFFFAPFVFFAVNYPIPDLSFRLPLCRSRSFVVKNSLPTSFA